MEASLLKTALIAEAKKRLAASIRQLEASGAGARQDALDHSVEYGSLYDIAKEEANALRAGLLRQIQKLNDSIAELDRIPSKACTILELGAVVTIAGELYFVSTGNIDEPIVIGGQSVQLVSALSPLIRIFNGKPVGTTAVLAGRQLTLEAIY